ncbi:MAG: AbrB/MazE/SpoVT family DNA-binding domain-containing protein [Coriobacteriia bacterium]|nr:AbrB/MazE/SpoVT family DNA-binding domain-containing protein [Coriobacteriia bacterium]
MNTISTLSKWGNGQGIRIPKAICEQIGASIGDAVDIRVDHDNTLILVFPKTKYQRRKKSTIDDLLKNQNSDFTSDDPWGDDIGAEVVE